MAYEQAVSLGDGTTTQFAVPFPYLRREHVKVYVDATPVTFSWVNDTMVQVTPAPAAGTSVSRRRETPLTPIHTIQNNKPTPASHYNELVLQAMYVAEERPGTQGLKGDTGDQGPKGDTGDQGETGPVGPMGPGFTVDATGVLATKDLYDDEPEGFSFLATDTSDIYIREGETGWSLPVPFGKGDKGDQGDPGTPAPPLEDAINGAAESTIAATDMLPARTSLGTLIKVSWSNLRSAAVVAFGSSLAARDEKSAVVDADLMAIADSEAANATKKVTLASLLAWVLSKVATSSDFLANVNGLLGVNKVWTAAVPVNLGSTWSGNQALTLWTFINGYATATGNFTFNTVTSPKNQSGLIRVTASGGNRTVGFNTANFATPNNAALPTIASGTTRLYSYAYDTALGKCIIVDMGTIS